MTGRADFVSAQNYHQLRSRNGRHDAPSATADTVVVDIARLVLDGSPRLEGEDRAHTQTLVEAESDLPPILVHRETMQVLDGMHRVLAARLRGERQIAAVYFDGDSSAAFVKAVEANTSHGLPLTLHDRRAAAQRIIDSYPEWSDRAVAVSTGLSTRTVRALRERSTDASSQLNARVGRDGRLRPLNAAEGRRRAATIIAGRPDATLREIADAARVSLGTARDVRVRLRQGEDPVPLKARRAEGSEPASGPEPGGSSVVRRLSAGTDLPERRRPSLVLRELMNDPSLRYSERGRSILRWFDARLLDPTDWSRLADDVPPHCVYPLAELATGCAQVWEQLAAELRSRFDDPAAA